MDSNAPLTNILEVAVPLLAAAAVATPVVISGLKGRWWVGVVGLVAFVGGFWIIFTTDPPSADFQETAAFEVLNVALNVAFAGGLILMVYGAARSARPESWWDRHRGGVSGAATHLRRHTSRT